MRPSIARSSMSPPVQPLGGGAHDLEAAQAECGTQGAP
jgi:hypothetical protein